MSERDRTGTSASIDASGGVEPPPRRIAIEDRPFWEGIDAGVLKVAHCPCGRCYVRSQACVACDAPASAMHWMPASGDATLLSYVVFDKAYHPYFANRLPYVVALVSLAEGPELVTNLRADDASTAIDGTLAIGTALRIGIALRGGYRLHEAAIADTRAAPRP